VAKKGKPGRFIAGVIAGLITVGVTVWIGPLIATVIRAGFLEPVEQREVTVDSAASLQRIHKALLLYAESEGALPAAEGWMDAAWLRIKTADMKEDEAKKMFKTSESQGEGEYGFAFSQELSQADPFGGDQARTLVFEAAGAKWNESRPSPSPDPAGKLRGITVEGNLVRLKP
jgi:hypothetical protein